MHVGSSLDAKNLEENVPGRGGCVDVSRGRNGKSRNSSRRRPWDREEELGATHLWPGLGRGLDESLWPTVAATILEAAGARTVVMHGAFRTHVVRRHVTLGCAGHGC